MVTSPPQNGLPCFQLRATLRYHDSDADFSVHVAWVLQYAPSHLYRWFNNNVTYWLWHIRRTIKCSPVINPHALSFSAVLFGILHAFYCVVAHSIPKTFIITDSLRAIQSINTRCWTSHIFVSKIVLLSSTLAKAGREISFMWVPGHCGVPGNEIADSLAKLATSNNRHQDIGQIRLKTVNTCVSFADICQHLPDHFDNVWNAQYQSDPKRTSYKAVFPQQRKETLRVVQAYTATLFRLRTGYCKLHIHLFRFCLHQDALCDACHTPETVAHFLLICPQYHAQRPTLLANLHKIGVNVNTADILRNPEASRHVQQFVNETNQTLWRTDEPTMRHGAKRPVMSKRQPPPHHNSLCGSRSVSEWFRMEARILRFNPRRQINLVFIIRRDGLLFLVDNEGCTSVFLSRFWESKWHLKLFQ